MTTVILLLLITDINKYHGNPVMTINNDYEIGLAPRTCIHTQFWYALNNHTTQKPECVHSILIIMLTLFDSLNPLVAQWDRYTDRNLFSSRPQS